MPERASGRFGPRCSPRSASCCPRSGMPWRPAPPCRGGPSASASSPSSRSPRRWRGVGVRCPASPHGLAVGQVALHAMFGLGQHGAAAPVDAASSDSSLAALAAQLICGGNSIPPSPEDARLILETAGLDPAAMVAQEHMAHAHMAHAPQTALLSPAMLLGHLLAALAMRLAARARRRRPVPARRVVTAVHGGGSGTSVAYRPCAGTGPRLRAAGRPGASCALPPEHGFPGGLHRSWSAPAHSDQARAAEGGTHPRSLTRHLHSQRITGAPVPCRPARSRTRSHVTVSCFPGAFLP